MREQAERSARPVTLAIRTRNPHAYRLLARTFATGLLTPGLDGRVPAHRQAILTAIADWLQMPGLDPATAVIPNSYPIAGGLYGEQPRSGDPTVDHLFTQLKPQDALLVLGTRRSPR
jgi:hypothetical protein